MSGESFGHDVGSAFVDPLFAKTTVRNRKKVTLDATSMANPLPMFVAKSGLKPICRAIEVMRLRTRSLSAMFKSACKKNRTRCRM
ncbi:hypothetical protein ATW55_05050 [Ferroacidibacillus organovorans]|uniref:Uncharacterized protein n=1 Tax=Ferroacidibacillus organovorans TaxID=1765683 RepID=A0A101XPH4_9BACL|nr:hypothetical protein ATW55_05050 [Ferroacidibacillus organovorans]